MTEDRSTENKTQVQITKDNKVDKLAKIESLLASTYEKHLPYNELMSIVEFHREMEDYRERILSSLEQHTLLHDSDMLDKAIDSLLITLEKQLNVGFWDPMGNRKLCIEPSGEIYAVLDQELMKKLLYLVWKPTLDRLKELKAKKALNTPGKR